MSRERRPVQHVTLRVTVRTADTRVDAPTRILKEVIRALEHNFGNAVTVEQED